MSYVSVTQTPQSGYAIVNQLSKDILGIGTPAVRDIHSFISVGQSMLMTGTENVMGAIDRLCATRIYECREYTGKWKLTFDQKGTMYNKMCEVVKYYPSDVIDSGDYNTDTKTNLGHGLTDLPAQGTGNQWEQFQYDVFKMYYGKTQVVWQKPRTVYENQLMDAFNSPDSFNSFISGYIRMYKNMVVVNQEAFSRMTVLNRIAGQYDIGTNATQAIAPESLVDLRALFNTHFNTSYTRTQLLTTYIKDFCEFLMVTLKRYSQYLETYSEKFHWGAPKVCKDGVTRSLLEFTPKSEQKLYMYSNIWEDVTAYALPEVFHDQYIRLPNFEAVDYWQFFDTKDDMDGTARTKIKIKPTYPDFWNWGTANDTGVVTGNNVELDYVVGFLFDPKAVMTTVNYVGAKATPWEARHRYMNIWDTWNKGAVNNFTSNAVLFYMSSGE